MVKCCMLSFCPLYSNRVSRSLRSIFEYCTTRQYFKTLLFACLVVYPLPFVVWIKVGI